MEKNQVHPLDKDEVTGIYSWEMWKREWSKTKSAEIRMALLHCGLDRLGLEQFLFYLSIADGARLQHPHPSSNEENTSNWYRHQVASKAFMVLCNKVFKLKDGLLTAQSLRLVTDPKGLDALLDFLRLAPGQLMFANQLRSKAEQPWGGHYREVIEEFLPYFVSLGWREQYYLPTSYPRYPQDFDDGEKVLLREARPRFVEILAALGKLGLLLDSPFLKESDPEDEVVMNKLKEIALGYPLQVPLCHPEYRKPHNVGEAAAFGSQAGRLYLLLHNRHKTLEPLRLRKIEELRRQQERATQALEMLT